MLLRECFFALLLSVFSWGALEALTPQVALQRLVDGNQRYAGDRSIHPDRTKERRQETAAKQTPFAVIVGCSDSRVAPEILFDQGIGDLFIVRVAGNVVGSLELESIGYSANSLKSALVLVLGHESCGAVNAVMQGQAQDMAAIAKLIGPAVEEAKQQKGSTLENAIKDNVQHVVEQLKGSSVLSPLIQAGMLNVVGGYYNFHTGLVELL